MLKNDLIRIGLIILAGILLLQLLNRSALQHNNVNEEVESPETYGNVKDSQEYYTGSPLEYQEHEDNDDNEVDVDEDYNDYNATDNDVEEFEDTVDSEPTVEKETETVGSYDMSDENAATVPSSAAQVPERPRDCFPKDTLTSEDLLPKDKYSKWAEVNPEGQGELKDRNFVEAGWHFGINTVGQSLRNANYQLRSEPANPQVKVSPWLQSTIGPDVNRRPLEIGGC